MTSPASVTDRAAQWAAWSALFSRVTQAVEPLPWYGPLDAHMKAHVREAITHTALNLRADRQQQAAYTIDRFCLAEFGAEQRAVWVERLSRIAEAVR